MGWTQEASFYLCLCTLFSKQEGSNWGKNNQVCYNEYFSNLSFEGIGKHVPWSSAFWPGLTPFGPPKWQAEADTELTLSASPTTAVGQKV